MIETEKPNIWIDPLRWWDIPAFAGLRHQIEYEATHLVPRKGERKESILYVLVRMIATRRRTRVLVALNDKRMVGYITVIFAKFSKLKGNAYLALSVLASHRNRGIGTKLLQAAEELARQYGIRRLELEVFAKNEGAVRLFKRMGFEEEGRRHKAVEDANGYDDVIFMAKFLS